MRIIVIFLLSLLVLMPSHVMADDQGNETGIVKVERNGVIVGDQESRRFKLSLDKNSVPLLANWGITIAGEMMVLGKGYILLNYDGIAKEITIHNVSDVVNNKEHVMGISVYTYNEDVSWDMGLIIWGQWWTTGCSPVQFPILQKTIPSIPIVVPEKIIPLYEAAKEGIFDGPKASRRFHVTIYSTAVHPMQEWGILLAGENILIIDHQGMIKTVLLLNNDGKTDRVIFQGVDFNNDTIEVSIWEKSGGGEVLRIITIKKGKIISDGKWVPSKPPRPW